MALFQILKDKKMFLPSNCENSTCFGSLKNINFNLREIKKILKSKDSLETKQNRLENLRNPVLSHFRQNQFKIPKGLVDVGLKISKRFEELQENKPSNVQSAVIIQQLNKYALHIKEKKTRGVDFGLIVAHLIYSACFELFAVKFKSSYLKMNEDILASDVHVINDSNRDFNAIKKDVLDDDKVSELLLEKKALTRSVAHLLDTNVMEMYIEEAKKKQRVFCREDKSLMIYEGELFKLIMQFIESSDLVKTYVETTVEKINVDVNGNMHKKFHKNAYFALNTKLFDEMLSMPLFSPNLPMIHHPKNWEPSEELSIIYEDKGNERMDLSEFLFSNKENTNFGGLHKGGPLKNEGNYAGVVGKIRNSFAIPSPHSVKLINNFQRQEFIINERMAVDINENYLLYLYRFLDMVDPKDWKNIIKFDSAFKEAKIISLDEYIEKTLGTTVGMVKFELDKQRNLLAKNYGVFVQIFSEYVLQIELMNLFRGFTLYFQWYFDLRGRAYPLAYLITPHGNHLSKSFLDLKDPNIELNDYGSEEVLEYYKSIQNSSKEDDWFMKRRLFELKETPNICPGDATAAGLSMSGAICGDYAALHGTNVFVQAGEEQKKQDLYKNVMIEIKRLFDKKRKKMRTTPY